MYWTQKGVELGDTESMIKLAREYSIGDIVPRNEAEEERWYTRAAELGNAQGYLGLSNLLKYFGNREKQYQFLRNAINLASRNRDEKSFADACVGLGYYYKPLENNPYADAKKSTYFFILAYVLGNDSSGDRVRENGYPVPQNEFEAWSRDAQDLISRM